MSLKVENTPKPANIKQVNKEASDSPLLRLIIQRDAQHADRLQRPEDKPWLRCILREVSFRKPLVQIFQGELQMEVAMQDRIVQQILVCWAGEAQLVYDRKLCSHLFMRCWRVISICRYRSHISPASRWWRNCCSRHGSRSSCSKISDVDPFLSVKWALIHTRLLLSFH